MNTEDKLKELGIRVAKCRRKIKLTQEELARKADVGKAQLSALERGTANVSMGYLFQVAEALGVRVADLLTDIEDGETWKSEETFENSSHYQNVDATCYPPDLVYYEISNLLQFVLYLPLIQAKDLIDSLGRINGKIEGGEMYLLQQINHCISAIPPSEAKMYADTYAEKLKRKNHIERKANGSYCREENDVHYDAYKAKIRRLEQFYKGYRMMKENDE